MKPNILLIFTDDHGWPYHGFMKHNVDKILKAKGKPGLTPNMDKLAEDGVVYTNAYVSAAHCQLSHYALLTGLNLRDIGTFGNISAWKIPSFVRKLKDNLGYKSIGMGKWWAGPGSRWFTDNTHNEQYLHFAREADDPGKGLNIPLNFIDRHEAAGEPWFMFCAPNLPHAPMSPPQEFIDGMEGINFKLEENATDYGPAGSMRYLGNIRWLDHRIGQIVNHLSDEVRKKTLIICYTDNGAGMDMSKAPFTEAGMRTPIILNYTGVIPPQGVSHELVGSIDMYPTILDYAGDASIDPRLVDSMSVRALAEKKTNSWRKVFFMNWKTDGEYAVRDSDYKLYADKSGKKPKVICVKTMTCQLEDEPNIISTPDGARAYSRLAPILEAWRLRKPYSVINSLVDAQFAAYPV